jgi:hypothetical protein
MIFAQTYADGWGAAGWGTALATVLGAVGILIIRERGSRAKLREMQAKIDEGRKLNDADVDGKKAKTENIRERAELARKKEYMDHIIDNWERLYGASMEREKVCQMEVAGLKAELEKLRQKHDEEINELRERLAKQGM